MAYTHSNAAAIAAVDAIVDLTDSGAGTATCLIYDDTGTVPTLADDSVNTNILLATVNLPNPAFGAAADQAPGALATLLGVPLSDTSIDATGTATFFRIVNRNGDTVFQGAVATSAAEMIVDTVSFVSGATFTITALTVSLAEG